MLAPSSTGSAPDVACADTCATTTRARPEPIEWAGAFYKGVEIDSGYELPSALQSGALGTDPSALQFIREFHENYLREGTPTKKRKRTRSASNSRTKRWQERTQRMRHH